MSDFQFIEKAQKVKNLCNETIKLLSTREEDEIKNLVSEFRKFLLEYEKHKKLTISFIGNYSAGKSTIIAALTNAKFVKKYYEKVNGEEKLIEVYMIGSKEIRIGAQVTTDRTEVYEWEDVLLIDTPGIYAGRPDHDEITLDQISKSDLLVFCIPNELFNQQSGQFFRKLSSDCQRVGQMALVINKMSRETGTPEDLKKTILNVIEPYHPDDFYTCFIDADFKLKALREKDEEEKKFLESKSNFADFIGALQNLIKKNQLYARLLTPLHRAVDIIEKSIDILGSNDKASRDFLEILRRKSLILKASQARLKNALNTELNKLEHEVFMIGEKVASMVDGTHSEEEINKELKDVEFKLQKLAQTTGEKIQSLIEDEFDRLKSELEELKQSPLGLYLQKEFVLAVSNKGKMEEISIEQKGEGSPILKKAPEIFNKLGDFASGVSKELVYKTWKFFGGKFKPWGALKATKVINKLGKILMVAGPIIEIIITIKEERERAKYEQELRTSRSEIRKEFRIIAQEMQSNFENGYEDEEGNKYEGLNTGIFKNFYQKELDIVEKEQDEIRRFERSKEEIVKQLKFLLEKIKDEIEIIQDGNFA